LEEGAEAMNASSTEGTFDICGNCPSHAHCCRRIQTFGQLEAPFLLKKEADTIAKRTATEVADFVDSNESAAGRDNLSLKAAGGKCYFYKNGSCTIYEDRPFDCRLFPFDIIGSREGVLFWIVYEELCPTKFDYMKYFASVKRLLTQSEYVEADLRNFASHGAEVMGRHKYKVIEPVQLPQG
jgi:Fe-S-cluster containining protein